MPPRASASLRRLAGVAIVILTACTSSPPADERDAPASPSPSPSDAVVQPGQTSVRAAPPDGGSFLVRGSYPPTGSRCVDAEPRRLLARYPGDVTVERADDGSLSLMVTVPFERYLEGIAEVPPSWPRAALEAQAVAARSYALARIGWNGPEGGTPDQTICATTACQVYRGIPVPRTPEVRRWYRAVRHTAGQVLLFEGRPADTVYFSTSNGSTLGNDEVFGSAPLPYLRPVPEEDDGASPTSRWTARVPFEDLGRFLGAAGQWPARRSITTVTLEGSTVEVSGGRVTRSMELSTFRDAVNTWAPCLMPHRYPGPSSRGTPLPVTVPSRWMDLTTERGTVVMTGRGWGHGVGMVQWGAYGKALRGMAAADILAHYYGGLRPEPYPEPGLIDVEVASGLRSVRLVPSDAGATISDRVLERDRVTISGGAELSVTVEPRGG
ncbi:MAG TPA: SpoIID/LytB domain-containing protein [Actinomycetota bacterium]|nr:SpoIID/LytB domain-containing protein [Actinomycetota bacterium]